MRIDKNDKKYMKKLYDLANTDKVVSKVEFKNGENFLKFFGYNPNPIDGVEAEIETFRYDYQTEKELKQFLKDLKEFVLLWERENIRLEDSENRPLNEKDIKRYNELNNNLNIDIITDKEKMQDMGKTLAYTAGVMGSVALPFALTYEEQHQAPTEVMVALATVGVVVGGITYLVSKINKKKPKLENPNGSYNIRKMNRHY